MKNEEDRYGMEIRIADMMKISKIWAIEVIQRVPAFEFFPISFAGGCFS